MNIHDLRIGQIIAIYNTDYLTYNFIINISNWRLELITWDQNDSYSSSYFLDEDYIDFNKVELVDEICV